MTLKRKPLIALCGLAGSGKDTAAQFIQEFSTLSTNRYCRCIAFADPIRDMIAVLMTGNGQLGAAPHAWMSDRALKEKPIPGIGHSYRKLAQTLGTEWGRSLDPDIWTNIARERINGLWYQNFKPKTIVITDLRFPNEAAMVHALGGEVWRIEGRSADIGTSHASEQLVQSIAADRVIDNSTNIADLHARLAKELNDFYKQGNAQ